MLARLHNLWGQENTNDKFDRGNIPLSILVHCEVNKLKGEDFGTRTWSIIIKGGMYYPETYGNTNKNQVISSSLSLKNGTRVTWINLDQNTKHSITVINDITDRKLFEKMIPFAGTAEYTFSTAGDYLFLIEHPYLNGRIKVNDNSDATRNVKM
jgi:plastocyanin